jgi:asparagine N-glycosylation enzyme membrane subunit Stt3
MALGAPMHLTIMALGHAFAAATVMGVWAVGREFGDERIANWSAFFAVISTALFTTLMDSAYTNVFGNFLTAAILVLIFRAAKEPDRFNVVCAVIALASLPLSHPDSIIHLLMAYVPFYFTVWLTRTRPTLNRAVLRGVLVPALDTARVSIVRRCECA